MPDDLPHPPAPGRVRRPAGLPADLVGAVLLVVLGVGVLGLALDDRLTLYVHPRYVALSVVMAVAAVVLATLGLVLRSSGSGATDPAVHDHPVELPSSLPASPTGHVGPPARVRPVLQVLLLALVVVCVLVLPPTTLSASLRADRGLNPVVGSGPETSTEDLVGADTTTFSVRDWAVLVQEGGADAVVGQPVDVTGYVLDRGEADVFYVARLVISCCAVDAQPVGVAVHSPGWRTRLRPDGWVRVQGTFAESVEAGQDAAPVVVEPTSVRAVDEPRNPYVF